MEDATSKLKNLKSKKTQLKRAASRFNSYLKSFPETQDLKDLKLRTDKFEPIWNQFEDIHAQIGTFENIDNQDEHTQFEDEYFNLLKRANEFLDNSSTKLNSTINDESDNRASSHIKLPIIKLPTFSGSYEDWFPFYDTFQSLIHKNTDLTDIQKFHYLKSALSGEASAVLHSLEISANNYHEAWEILRTRYDNKRLIIQKHIKAMVELPNTMKENYTSLRHILDGILRHYRTLTALQRPTEHWDDLLVYILTTKLDTTTSKDWESTLNSTEMPTFKELTDFLTRKCQTLEVITKASSSHDAHQNTTYSRKFQHNKLIQNTASHNKTSSYLISNRHTCTFCKGNHLIYQCDSLIALAPNTRVQEVKARKLCINCLRDNHFTNKCTSISCKTCGKKHHTLLHLPTVTPSKTETHETSTSQVISNHGSTISLTTQVLLPTAIINIQDVTGHKHLCRALLDSGSQSNLITEKLANRLNLRQQSTHITISGISQSTTVATRSLKAKIQSLHSGFDAEIDCLILKQISELIPISPVRKSDVNIPANIKLADPEFHISKEIDLLIGAELFYKLLCVGQIDLGTGRPCLQKTLFGWIISGKLENPRSVLTESHCNIATIDLNHALTKFWELEGYSHQTRPHTSDEKYCEKHFLDTFYRNNEGRFVVSLPFKQDASRLGNSREQALKRFYSIERKLERDPHLKAEYSSFMQEYLALGHMKQINDVIDSGKPHFYLPHHAVLKEKSITTKLRVVFDGSAKTSTGTSLNDILHVGPKLQQDLFDIIIRFRTFKVAITADIVKMYRQVLSNENDTSFQRILWRDNKHEDIKTYELNTVTYGTSSAPFLAIRALQELAVEEENTYPKGSQIILRDFYVDDLLTGAQTVSEAEMIRNEIVNILTKGGFELRKWISNKHELLENIITTSDNKVVLNLNKGEEINMLGLQWDPCADNFQYSVQEVTSTKRITKRFILSSVAKIFDPLGLISPVIITAKMLMQRIWKLNLDWDESVSTDIQSTCLQYATELQYINDIRIGRNVVQIDKPEYSELHGFCDASEQAYGACIYVRSVNAEGTSSCNLLCSKSRVAPTKTISLPRLELCGALTLAQLMNKVIPILNIHIKKVYYWTDSTIVLNWLNSSSGSWKTFVANRVSEIQELADISSWHHVRTRDNPADFITRGITVRALSNNTMWWQGPGWLQTSENWPSFNPQYENIDLPEKRRVVHTIQLREEIDWFNKYSSLMRLIRVLTYCRRFKNNIIQQKTNKPVTTGPLETRELESTMNCLIKIAQEQSFGKELTRLREKKQVDAKSSILSLNPFLDENGIIRVGGRLKHSKLSYEQKHQILLCGNHPLTALIVTQEHHKQLHSGVQSTLASIRQKFWSTSAKNIIKGIIRKCVICFKANPRTVEYQMGNLPPDRIRPARPFENVGVDYFGPIQIREGRRKNSKTVKTYGAVFVCFSTRAIHLELVGNLTAESFLSALRRFMGRRGKPSNIYSDNGTQFVGGDRVLMELQQHLRTEQTKVIIHQELTKDNIQWHFISPRSPHFGGLWEAAVKSVKYHLSRTMHTTSLNYEEMNTLLIQIEAILNSRPLSPISNDPNDLNFLSPSHFLIGDSLTCTPEPNLMHLKINQVSRWQYIQQIRQHFWKRWSREYVNQLQARNKWKINKGPQLQPGSLVIIREENTPPHHWSTGRILEVFSGRDHVSRVATVKTAKGILKTGANRLCILPIEP